MVYEKGQSGNPGGRPKGSRNKATVLLEGLFDNEAETIARKVVQLAKEGDLMAAKLVLERLIPPAKERRITLSLPEVTTAQAILAANAAVIEAVTSGELSPQEGQAVQALIEGQRKAIETQDHATRIEALEKQLTLKGNK
jgi:hypothetical protein